MFVVGVLGGEVNIIYNPPPGGNLNNSRHKPWTRGTNDGPVTQWPVGRVQRATAPLPHGAMGFPFVWLQFPQACWWFLFYMLHKFMKLYVPTFSSTDKWTEVFLSGSVCLSDEISMAKHTQPISMWS